MNTRKYPRTMDQAFGPYQRSSQCEIVPMKEDRITLADKVLYALAPVCVLVAIIFNHFGI
jgi:hypothetical protein